MKKVVVIGMGKSGQAAFALLERQGHQVVGVDADRSKGFQSSEEVNVSEFDLVVVSPGIPPSDLLYQEAVKKGVEVIGEAELALREIQQPCLAITGTNGKTTVTLLIEHILNSSGKKAKALGNVGEPFSDYLKNSDPAEIIVAELSSYQLETLHVKAFDIGVILNITPDHLDRYSSMEEYAKAKCRLQDCLKEGANLYVNMQVLKEFGPLLKDGYRTYGSDSGSFLWTDGSIVKEVEKIEYFLPMHYRKTGIHESENALAAWAICKELGIEMPAFVKGLETFQKPAHRIEFVADIDGVRYYDDSKGTNVDATICAVSSMPGPVILIAGGVDKGSSYEPWKEHFRGKIRRIVALGKAALKISKELEDAFDVAIVPTMQDAVELASREANRGECVLLSPGCSSFDMFRDYAHRGEEFKRFVHHLEERRKKNEP